MPTGYTYKVANGEVTDFASFAKMCARAFGAAVHQRDDAADAPLSLTIPRSTYHHERLAEQRAELARWQEMSDQQVFAEAAKNLADDLEYYLRRLRETTQARERYAAMRAKVEAWVPPTSEHEGLKKFMLEQLDVSIRGEYEPTRPDASGLSMTAARYRQKKIDGILREIEYHEESIEKDEERCSVAEAWLRALVDSLEEK